MMTPLPDISDLLKRTKALAAIELILSPEWQYRYYSFNAAWGAGEMMASMRNGCGDEWWLVFHCDGWAALKGLAHEAPAWSKGGEALSKALAATFPKILRSFSSEPAFRWDATGFAYFYLPTGGRWVRANDLTPFADLDAGEDELLRHLIVPAESYCDFACDYYETAVPIEIVKQVFNLSPISENMVSELNPNVAFADIKEELYSEIGYPH